MNAEHIKVRIGCAVDLLQIISEDFEDNFLTPQFPAGAKARGILIVSMLTVLSDYLEHLRDEVTA